MTNRAQRRANNKKVIKNRLKELKDLNINNNQYSTSRNRLNKQDAFDCGNPKCTPCTITKRFCTLDNKGNKRRDNKFDLKDLEYE